MKREKAVTVLLLVIFTASLLKTGIDISRNEDTESNFTAATVEVIDGDTVDISRDGVEDTVRVLGIDTPEVTGENTPSEFFLENSSENRQCLRTIGEKASDLAEQELSGETVQVVTDPESDRRGSYGRLLAYIQYNRTSLGEEMLERGYARVYNSSFSRIDEYRRLERESREEERGIWNSSC